MDDQTTDALLRFARDLGLEAGQQLLAWRGRAGATLKEDGTVITDADRAVDRWLCEAIRKRFPEHDILSEEADAA